MRRFLVVVGLTIFLFTLVVAVGYGAWRILTTSEQAPRAFRERKPGPNPLQTLDSASVNVTRALPGQESGTFWVDRWGQGRFGMLVDFVDESLFPKLRPHVGIPIHLFQPWIDLEDPDSPTCLTKLGSIQPLPQPVSIRLKWMENGESPVCRLRDSQDAIFQVEVTNRGAEEVSLSSYDLMLLVTVRHPPANGGGYTIYGGTGDYGSGRLRRRGVLRYFARYANLGPQDSEFPWCPVSNLNDRPPGGPVQVQPSKTHAWKVTISNSAPKQHEFDHWLPNEYEIMVRYRKSGTRDESGGSYTFSNPLSLDVLTDEPRQDDVMEMSMRLRENAEIKPGQPVPLEIVFRNKLKKELRFPFSKGTPDDLDLSDFLFCYDKDGRVLPLTKKVSGSMEIVVPVNEPFVFPIDAPEGTVVARAVFLDGKYSPATDDKVFNLERYAWGWHWSEHWQAPSLRRRLE